MPEIACLHFEVAWIYLQFIWTICKEQRQKFLKIGDSRCNYQNELNNVCFQLGISYCSYENLARETVSDKLIRNVMRMSTRACKNGIYFFDKKTERKWSKSKVAEAATLPQQLTYVIKQTNH